MKKIILFVLSVTLAGTVLSSCKTHKRCAAYGKANPVNSSVKS